MTLTGGLPFDPLAVAREEQGREPGHQEVADAIMRRVAALLPDSFRGHYADSETRGLVSRGPAPDTPLARPHQRRSTRSESGAAPRREHPATPWWRPLATERDVGPRGATGSVP